MSKNLRGGNYDSQIKDGFHRISAFGKSRYGLNSHKTHSDGMARKREMYLRDYKKFIEEKGLKEKLNQTMTNENIKEFLDKRTNGLANSTQKNYTSSFHSMVQALKEVGISISVDKKIFENEVKEIKLNATNEFKTNRSVKNISSVLSRLHEKRFESATLAQIQVELGVRTSESYKIIENFNSLYNKENGTIDNLIGKANHQYNPKIISLELAAKIKACNIENLPSQDTYRKDLKEVGVDKAHDLRITYAKNEFEKQIATGIEFQQCLKNISSELNHKRESMTLYYLARA